MNRFVKELTSLHWKVDIPIAGVGYIAWRWGLPWWGVLIWFLVMSVFVTYFIDRPLHKEADDGD